MIFRWQSPLRLVAELSRALYARIRGYELLAGVEVEEARLEKCLSCEFLDEETEQCGVCSCFVRAKAMVAVSRCPKKKWGPVFVRKDLTISEK